MFAVALNFILTDTWKLLKRAWTYFVGISSLAVALMHSYTFHEHELRVADIAKSLGFTNISLSSQIMPMVRLVPRGFTASVKP